MVARWLVVAIFVLSGAAGLVYEVVWSRQLVLVFGNTTQAVSAILTGFFGGMALGNVLGGRLADRVSRPLRLYGALEILVAIVALATPLLFRFSLEVYRGSFATLEQAPGLLALVRFALALLALGPATVLLGATLPTLTRHLSRGGAGLAASFAVLYAANTVGAVLGAAVSGFVLIELLGLTGALEVGVAASLTAGVVALALDLGSKPAGEPTVSSGPPVEPDPATSPGHDGRQPQARPDVAQVRGRLTLALGFAFVSGLTALGYQTLWTRLLASGTGNSTYVFSLILVVFLTGLAIGSAAYRLVGHRIQQPTLALGVSQALIAILALIGLVAVISRPVPLEVEVDDVKAVWGVLWPAVFKVVLPPTIVMGFALPLASRLLGATDRTVGERTGLLLGANTLGSIVGTFLIPFLVIPTLGSPASVFGLALINIATAIVLFVRGGTPTRWARLASRPSIVAAVVVAVVALALPGAIVDPGVARIRVSGGEVWASAEDEIASVQAGRIHGPQLWVTGTAMTAMTVDTRLMPYLSLALRPASSRALVIAFGMGASFRSSLRAGLQTDAVELVPSVPSMFGWYFPDAAQVLADPRGRIIIDDGRNYVELTDRHYDIVVVDPPPPIYSSGVSVISSLEFYQAARQRLTPGGVMMEWVPNGQSLEEFKAHVRTYASVFPHVLLVHGSYGTYMFGSDEALAFDEAALRAVLSRPGVLEDLSDTPDAPTTTVDGWLGWIPGHVWLADGQAPAWAGPGPEITDDRPLPEYFLLRRLTGCCGV
jgi:spermidine synthase